MKEFINALTVLFEKKDVRIYISDNKEEIRIHFSPSLFITFIKKGEYYRCVQWEMGLTQTNLEVIN